LFYRRAEKCVFSYLRLSGKLVALSLAAAAMMSSYQKRHQTLSGLRVRVAPMILIILLALLS